MTQIQLQSYYICTDLENGHNNFIIETKDIEALHYNYNTHRMGRRKKPRMSEETKRYLRAKTQTVPEPTEATVSVSKLLNEDTDTSDWSEDDSRTQHNKGLSEAVTDSCDKHLIKMGENIKGDDDIAQCTVSGDGTWLKRGMSSKIGVASVISASTGQILDRIVLCNYCKLCQAREQDDKTSLDYLNFMADHLEDCPINHEGSAASMEVEGMSTLFSRSEEKHGLQYTTYIGDGDSKTYRRLMMDDPYNGVPIHKKGGIRPMRSNSN